MKMMNIFRLALLGYLYMNSNVFSNQLEDEYLSEKSFPIVKDNYVVISGCSGGGKSSLLSELASRGYPVVQEPGRQIVKEQIAINGDALPWSNPEKFLDLALSRYILQFNSQKQQQLIFFDRGIIDALQLDSSQPEYFQRAAQNFRYNRLIFLVPPWEEIFANDTERKHNFESAKKEFNELLIKYKNVGYETVLVPKMPVKERADFILEKLGIHPSNSVDSNFFISKAVRLLEWNKQKLTSHSNLTIEDLNELFAQKFVVIANGREYDADHPSYYEFLNKFRSDIDTIDYQVQEYFNTGATVLMPLVATVKRLQGKEEIFDAILFVKFNDAGKIIHWQEVYSIR
jgi:predicted ATPase